ncbi:tRNA pseudouridine(55) synthase TruB [Candidatus Peregrinibacteria bacterium]|nr:tRNA pseudouridine(55) synthase TruB [Candidatus Peregrinibacteria bacterium]
MIIFADQAGIFIAFYSSYHHDHSMRHGFLLINKPEGPTSHDAVAAVRRVLHEKDVGHLGTLDPLASGLLVLAVGSKALKVIELFNQLSKEYVAIIRFGAVSATYDREGPLEDTPRKPGVEIPTESQIRELILNHFIGRIEQVPPAASAISIGGERAYRKMRQASAQASTCGQGPGFIMPSRIVQIDSCEILSYEYPDLELKIRCGSGTYIRSLAHDMGRLLRVGGYLLSLDRTEVGEWSVQDAVAPEKAVWTNVLPLKDILRGLPSRELTEGEFDAIAHGRIIHQPCERNTVGWFQHLPVALLESSRDGQGTKARKVL